jgi:2-keto-4-pentenoate hydratase
LRDFEALSAEIDAAMAEGRSIARIADLTLEDARRIFVASQARRLARGEKPVGRKIGFTNRTIWAEYGVYAPNWGYMTERSVSDLPRAGAVSLQHFAEPRIEPEIVFGLAQAPSAGMDEAALMRCIGWVAHGFEIVHSIFPNWKFTPAETLAANALHGALLIGPRRRIVGARDRWVQDLASFEVALYRNGKLADRGRAENVLGSPLSALRHLVQLLGNDSESPPLAAGEIVTTGTLTRALPVAAGETWRTELKGVGLDGIEVRFS